MSNIDLTSKNVSKTLLTFSIPMMLLAIMDYMAVFIDLSWLMAMSELEQLPTTLKLAFSIVAILEAVLAGILAAIYIFANQSFGKKDYPVTSHLLNFGFGVCIIMGITVGLMGIFGGHYIVSLFGVDELITSQVIRYLEAYWYGYIAVLVYIYAGLVVKMSGNLKVIIKFRVWTFLCNIIITPLFIYVGMLNEIDLLKMAALSTVTARVFGLAIMLYFVHRSDVFPFKLGIEFWPNKICKQWSEILKLGSAETLNSFSLSFSFFAFFMILSHFEKGAFEAVTVGQYMTGFFQTIFMGVMGTLIPFTAQNAGIKNMRNIQVGVNWMTRVILIAGLIVVIPLVFLSPYIAQLFTSDVVAIERIVNYIQITAIPWAFLIASFPFIFAVIGMGDAKGILLLTIWSMYLANLAPLLAVLIWVGDSTQMVAIAESTSQILTFFGCWAYFKYSQKKMAVKWGIITPQAQIKSENNSVAGIQLKEKTV